MGNKLIHGYYRGYLVKCGHVLLVLVSSCNLFVCVGGYFLFVLEHLMRCCTSSIHCAPSTTCQHSRRVKLDKANNPDFTVKYHSPRVSVGHVLSKTSNPASAQKDKVTRIARIAVW